MRSTHSFKKLSLALIAGATLALAGCDSDDDHNPATVTDDTSTPTVEEGPGNILAVANEVGSFETLITALEAAGLDSTVGDEDQTLTVFAPTDDAFAALPEGALDALLNDVDALTDVLLYHVIAGDAVNAETALSLAGTTVEMANGKNVAVTQRGDDLFINESTVVQTDVEASNGVIHVLNAVLIPPTMGEPAGNIVEIAQATEDLSTLVAAVLAAGLETTLADPDATFTVFAPTNAAFAALGEETINGLLSDIPALTNILLYHVIQGAAVDSITATSLFGQMATMANEDSVSIDIRDGEIFINDSKVVMRDVPATNGVVHVIDAVLIPPAE